MSDENKPPEVAPVAPKSARSFAPKAAAPAKEAPRDKPGVPAPDKLYGELADAARDAAANHDGPVTFTVRNEEDRHQLFRALSGSKHRKSVLIDETQEERVTWKAAE